MSDVASPEDVLAVYNLGLQSVRNQLSVGQIIDKLKFPRLKAAAAINALVEKRYASQPKPNDRGENVVQVREADLAKALKELKGLAYPVFCVVEQSQSSGVAARDILRTINDLLKKKGMNAVTQAQVNKELTQMEAARIIKAIKSIHGRGQKLYIVANVEADTSVVGGAFYKDGDFDDELVEQYRDRILHFVTTHNSASKKDVVGFLRSSGFRVDLSEPDLEKVFRTLVLDQRMTQTTQASTGEIYFAVARWPVFEEIESIPCFSCPVFECCQIEEIDRFDAVMLRQSLTIADKNREAKNGVKGLIDSSVSLSKGEFTSKVNPSTCPYYSQWLGLTMDPCVPKPEEKESEET